MPIAVPCPNCSSLLKAPDGMAGKKARCKKCQHSFLIPGEVPAEQADSVGDSHHLSVVEDSPFAFDAGSTAPEPKPAPAVAKASSRKPTPAKAAEDNPFSIPTTAVEVAPSAKGAEEKSNSKYRQKPASKQSKSPVAEKVKSPSSNRVEAPAMPSKGKGRSLLFLLGGLLCAVGGAGGFYAYTEHQKSKNSTSVAANSPAPVPVQSLNATGDAAPVAKSSPNAKVAAGPGGEATAPEAGEKSTTPGRTRTVRVTGGVKIPPTSEKPMPYEKVRAVVTLPHAAADAKQLLVGGDDGPVVAVVRRTDLGIGGKGIVDTVEVYALSTQKLRDATKVPGDDIKTFPRLCDLSPSGDRFACEYPVGKLSVFQLGTENRLLDGQSLTEKPDDKQPGIAAIFFLSDEKVGVFTKDGSVVVYDIGTKKRTSRTEPLPETGNWVPRRTVVVQRDRDPDKSKFFAYSAGAIYEIPVKGKPKVALSLTKKPSECLAIGVDSGGNRIAAAFKATDPGEHVRFIHGRSGDTKPSCDESLDVTDMGMPVALEWNRAETFTILTEKGVGFAYDADSNKMIVGIRPSSLKVQQFHDRAHHWCLLPDKQDAKKSHLVNVHIPPENYSSLQIGTKWEPFSVGVTIDGTTK